jgi:plasmid replication initiation protein/phenylpyruvate tautomerase PptA (4-oxalocrotonate tautomerase family)
VQSNHLIEARNKTPLTFLEKLIFAKMCAMIDPKDTDFIDYTIYIRDVIEILGITDGGGAYQNIIDAAKKLKSREITIIVKDKETGREEILDTNLVIGVKRAKITKDARDMYVKLSFHPDLKPYLLQLKSNFTLLDIRNFVRLHSGSTMRIYELLKQYENTNSKQREISLETLKNMLGVTDKYPMYGNFKQKILEEAQRRINESTDITFTFEEIKDGRKVTAIRFKITKKSKISTAPIMTTGDVQVLHEPPMRDETTQNQLFDEIYQVVKHWNITATTLLRLVDDYSPGVLRSALRLTQKNEKQGKISDNIGGFFIKAVKEGFIDNTEKATQEREKRRDIAVIKRQYQESREQKTLVAKEALVKRQTEIAMNLINAEKELITQAIEKMQKSFVGRTVHNMELSFEENLASPLFVSAFVSAVISLRPSDFENSDASV